MPFYVKALIAAQVFMMIPVAVGIVDMWFWIMAGHQITSVPWESDRVALLFILVILMLICSLPQVNYWVRK